MNEHEYICPRGHHMLERHSEGFRCIECDRHKDVWNETPIYGVGEVYHVEEPPKDPFGELPNTVGRVGSRLNCHTKMLPFSRWKYNRFNVGRKIDDYLSDLHELRRTFKLRHFAPTLVGKDSIADLDQIDMNNACSERMWLIHGVQPTDNVSANQKSYLNPNYVHYDACGPPHGFDESDLRYWVRLYATVGRVEPETVERNLGIDSVYDYDPNWDYRRKHGRVWLANTLSIVRQWEDASYGELAKCFGMPKGSVHHYVTEIAQLKEWPPDPSLYDSFGRTRGKKGYEIDWPEVKAYNGGEAV